VLCGTDNNIQAKRNRTKKITDYYDTLNATFCCFLFIREDSVACPAGKIREDSVACPAGK